MKTKPLTVSAFQRHIRSRYYATDSARGVPATFLWFMEEVGELATALASAQRLQASGTTASKASARERLRVQTNLQEEFADVLAWLCTLANISDVDLQQAIHAKYLSSQRPKGHK